MNPSLKLPIKLNLDSNSPCLISGGIIAGEWLWCLAEECLDGCAWVGACGRHWVPRPYPVTLPISTHGGLTASVHQSFACGHSQITGAHSAPSMSVVSLPCLGVRAPFHSNSPHPVTDRRWYINTPGPSPVCGDNLEVRVHMASQSSPTEVSPRSPQWF